jgi:hypothetical protein
MLPNMDKLAELFGSQGEISRITGVSTGAVARWGKRYAIAPRYQHRLVQAAETRGLDWKEVAAAAGVPKCPNCGTFHYNLGRAK